MQILVSFDTDTRKEALFRAKIESIGFITTPNLT